jgi:hypothetical protein
MTFSHVSSDQRIESLIRGLAILAAYLLSGSFLGFMGGAVWEVLRLTRRSALSILFRIMTFGVMTGLAMWGIMFPLLRHGEGQGFEIVFAISAAVYAVFIAGLAEFLSRGKY